MEEKLKKLFSTIIHEHVRTPELRTMYEEKLNTILTEPKKYGKDTELINSVDNILTSGHKDILISEDYHDGIWISFIDKGGIIGAKVADNKIGASHKSIRDAIVAMEYFYNKNKYIR